jgi:UDP-glucose 4-epimerase
MGSHLAAECITLGQEVVVLDDLSGGFTQNIPAGVTFVRGSVDDDSLVKELFARFQFDYVYHLAAYAAEGLSHFIRRFNYTNNLLGTVTLTNAAIRNNIKRFVFTSSIAVYGSAQLPMTEETVPSPEDPYGIAKYAAELDLRAAHELFGLDYTIFRPHNVYGERQNIGDRYRNVIGIFMNQIMQNQPLTVFGDGLQTRAFSHISDVVPRIASCIGVPESRNRTFNVGGDSVCTVLDLAKLVAEAFGVEPDVIHLPPRKEVLHAYSSHEAADGVFGRREQLSLRTGIMRMAEWARQEGARTAAPFRNIEISRNLPRSWAATSAEPLQTESVVDCGAERTPN